MKSLFHSLLLLLAPTAAFAQPTLTQASLPVPGLTLVVHYDTTGSAALPLTPPGPAQTWNYASYFPQTITFTNQFIDPATVPAGFRNHFPTANLAIYEPGFDQAAFYKTQNTGLYVDGSISVDTPGDTFTLDYQPNLLLIPVPFTYQDSRTHTARYVRTNLQAGEKYVSHINQTFTADAWGTLNLPSGSFPNTLRFKMEYISIDSFFIYQGGNWVFQSVSQDSEPDTYLWSRNDPASFLLLEARIDDQNPGFSSATGTYYYSSSMLSAPETVPAAQVQPFPNPATAQITIPIEAAGAHRLLITDAAGRKVALETVQGVHQLRYGTAHLPAGMYAYQLMGKNGETLQQGRFSVLK